MAVTVIKATETYKPQYFIECDILRISAPTSEFKRFMTVEKNETYFVCDTVFSENGIRVAYYGESIRTGYETASGIFKAMIKDPSDSSSILDMDYTHIGIGIYKNAKNTYWAILYCSLAE